MTYDFDYSSFVFYYFKFVETKLSKVLGYDCHSHSETVLSDKRIVTIRMRTEMSETKNDMQINYILYQL